MSDKQYNFQVCVISSKRPEAAKAYAESKRFDDVVLNWYVGLGEARDYYAMGAQNVIEAGGLMESRNKALQDCFAQDKTCVQISDDMKKLQFRAEGMPEAREECFSCAIKKIMDGMDSVGAYLGGVAPTDNLFFSDGKLKDHHFVVGDFIVVKPNPLRFDENLRLKEDYDYTLQHLTKFGKVARYDAVIASFLHRKNKGGAVDYRTSELEQDTIKYLLAKWGDHLRPNPRRQNEILLKWKQL